MSAGGKCGLTPKGEDTSCSPEGRCRVTGHEPDAGCYYRTDAALFVKHDGGKTPWSMLPWGPMTSVVAVMAYGAKKYTRDNWQRGSVNRYVDAAFRHLIAYSEGKKTDPESGLPHLAHLVCCGLFAMWLDDHNGGDA